MGPSTTRQTGPSQTPPTAAMKSAKARRRLRPSLVRRSGRSLSWRELVVQTLSPNPNAAVHVDYDTRL